MERTIVRKSHKFYVKHDLISIRKYVRERGSIEFSIKANLSTS